MESIQIAGMCASRVGFGCAAIGGHDYGPVDDRVSRRAVAAALDAGITLFDVADIYGLGHAEQILSAGLGARRRDVIIATKFGVRWDARRRRTFRDISPAYLRRALEASLRRLRLDCIPLYQVHWLDGKTALDDALEELDRCRSAGKIRAVGLSNVDPRRCAHSVFRFRVDSVQLPFSLADQRHGAALEYGRRGLGIETLAYNVLAHGFLSGKYGRDAVFPGADLRGRPNSFLQVDAEAHWRVVEVLASASARLGMTPAQIAIRWALDQSSIGCVLVGAKDAAQVRQNVEAMEKSLPAGLRRILDSKSDVAPRRRKRRGKEIRIT